MFILSSYPIMQAGCTESQNVCEQATLPHCDVVFGAPTQSEQIENFIEQNAIALECDPETDGPLVLHVVEEHFDSKKLFIFGEVHGSSELGHMSAEIFAWMVRRAGVRVLGMEIPMDVTDALNEYIETGSGKLEDVYGFDEWTDSIFWKVLPVMARELYQEGVQVSAFGVDVPWDMTWVDSELNALADRTSPTVAGIIRDSMPSPVAMGSEVDLAYTETVKEYTEHILEHEEMLTAALSESDWLRLTNLVRGYYLSALNSMPGFGEGATDGLELWLQAREKLLFDNFRFALREEDARVYAHMGANHAGKSSNTVAGMLNTGFEPTKGKCYSTAPAYGPGSQVRFAGKVEQLQPEPPLISNVLEDAAYTSYFLATTTPGQDCQANPIAAMEVSTYLDADYRAFDALLWVRQLTPERVERSFNEGRNQSRVPLLMRWDQMIQWNEGTNSPKHLSSKLMTHD